MAELFRLERLDFLCVSGDTLRYGTLMSALSLFESVDITCFGFVSTLDSLSDEVISQYLDSCFLISESINEPCFAFLEHLMRNFSSICVISTGGFIISFRVMLAKLNGQKGSFVLKSG